MNTEAYDPGATELARDFTVRDYEAARDSRPPDKHAIAEAIHRRFTDRYINPVTASPKHGFTIMAVSCLMIEALESFRNGWENSKHKSQDAFCSFFSGCAPFAALSAHAHDFYTHVRCGILHQAETTGGWRIRRDNSPLFDAKALTLNAECFIQALREALRTFCDDLNAADWSSPEWTKVVTKMDAIAKNCQRD